MSAKNVTEITSESKLCSTIWRTSVALHLNSIVPRALILPSVAVISKSMWNVFTILLVAVKKATLDWMMKWKMPLPAKAIRTATAATAPMVIIKIRTFIWLFYYTFFVCTILFFSVWIRRRERVCCRQDLRPASGSWWAQSVVWMLRISRGLDGLMQRRRKYLRTLWEHEEMSGGYWRVTSTAEEDTEETFFQKSN